MIGPRRAHSAGDQELLTGVLGAIALVDKLRALVSELVDDGSSEGEGSPADAGVVEVVLGLAALAGAVEREGAADVGAADIEDDAGIRRTDAPIPQDLLR